MMSTDEDQEIALALNSAVTRLGRRIRRIDDGESLGRARLSALSVLVFGGPRSPSALAEEEMVSGATMHHVINGLIDEGLAIRQADEMDRRRQMVIATSKGEQFMHRARENRLKYYREKLAELGPTDRKAMARFARVALSWLDEPLP